MRIKRRDIELIAEAYAQQSQTQQYPAYIRLGNVGEITRVLSPAEFNKAGYQAAGMAKYYDAVQDTGEIIDLDTGEVVDILKARMFTGRPTELQRLRALLPNTPIKGFA